MTLRRPVCSLCGQAVRDGSPAPASQAFFYVSMLHTAIVVKPEFLHKDFAMGKNHHDRKSGKMVEAGRIILCEPKMNIHNAQALWKTPVEKPVENVENSELSTGISPV